MSDYYNQFNLSESAQSVSFGLADQYNFDEFSNRPEEPGPNTELLYSTNDNFSTFSIKPEQIQIEEPLTITPASQLLSKWSTSPALSTKKATNFPKFTVEELLHEFFEDYSRVSDSGRYKRWLDSAKRRLDRDKASRLTPLVMLEEEPNESEERKLWKAKHRQMFQARMVRTRVERVLGNQSIPHFNKKHYMYWMKLYEWRLNNQQLLKHLT